MVGVKKEPRSATSAVGYVRVSTEEQVLGPDAQRAALEQWAVARRVELVAVFEDRGVSGATPLDRRPGLLAAARVHGPVTRGLARRSQAGPVRPGRHHRSPARALGRAVTAVSSSRPMAPAMVTHPRPLSCGASSTAMSEYERCLIRGRTKAALATKRAKGLKFGSTAPIGWRFNGELLEPDVGEQRAVARIQRARHGGQSPSGGSLRC
jgi:hypothetical protein